MIFEYYAFLFGASAALLPLFDRIATEAQKRYISALIFSDRTLTLAILETLYKISCILLANFVENYAYRITLLILFIFISVYAFILGLGGVGQEWIETTFAGDFVRICFVLAMIFIMYFVILYSLTFFIKAIDLLYEYKFFQCFFNVLLASAFPCVAVRFASAILIAIGVSGYEEYYIINDAFIVFVFSIIGFIISYFITLGSIVISIIAIIFAKISIKIPIGLAMIANRTNAPNHPFSFSAIVLCIALTIVFISRELIA